MFLVILLLVLASAGITLEKEGFNSTSSKVRDSSILLEIL
jgi:hypothetical protein